MSKNRYKHNFNDGDIVTDLQYNEVFIFNDKTDGYKAENKPNTFRLATDEEKKILGNSGDDCIDLKKPPKP